MPDLLCRADWGFPVPIHYGPGRLGELGRLCGEAGITAPLVVTDRGSRDLPFLARLIADLEKQGMAPAVFSEVAPNPRDSDVEAGRRAFRSGGHDGVLAVGGGSGMDAGKAISLVAGNDLDLMALDYDKAPPEPPAGAAFAPLICVPTTAGTGAETESTAMVTDTRRAMKICVWHPRQKPLAALLDPEVTVGLPRTLTAWTGCDAMVHGLEAYLVPALNPLCDGIALEALRLISRWLPRAVEEGADVEARGGMLLGSCLAGISFLKGLGLVHAMSHMVGAVYDTHHGLTNAVLLPTVLRYNEPAIADKVPPICQALGLPGQGFADLYGAVVALLDRLDIPRSLGALGVAADSVPDLARKAHQDGAAATNPRPAGVPEIEALLREAIEEGR